MRILLTGYNGYIGTVLTPLLIKQNFDLVGVDTHWYPSAFDNNCKPHTIIDQDIRLLTINNFKDIDCVIHLAALCNDPLGELNSIATYDINYLASVKLAKLAKQAGVKRFIYASSCSLYGGSGGELVDETAEFTPLTHYAKAKTKVEDDIFSLANESFCVSCLRFATAYGYSPQLRGDLVINNLCYYALKQGEVFLKSKGLAWRPFIHVEDISRCILAFVKAKQNKVNHQAFNIGENQQNHKIIEIADKVKKHIPNSKINFANNAYVDERNYRVSFNKFEANFPEFNFNWSIDDGIKDLKERLEKVINNVNIDLPELNRVTCLKQLQNKKILSDDFFWESQKAIKYS